MSNSLWHALASSDKEVMIPLIVVGCAFAMRLHCYRHFRKLLLPAVLATILFRAVYYPDAESLLVMITNYISSLNEKRASLVGGDILGFLVGFIVVKYLAYALTLRPETVVADIMNAAFAAIKSNPLVQRELVKERAKMEEVIEHDLKSKVRVCVARKTCHAPQIFQ